MLNCACIWSPSLAKDVDAIGESPKVCYKVGWGPWTLIL